MKALVCATALFGLLQIPVAAQSERSGRATHYGASYNGQRMGCGGVYRSGDPTIIAVGASNYRTWPCGTALVVSGPNGTIVGTRQDACPGCDSAGVIVDLSEEGHRRVCGVGTCWVTVRPYVAPAPPPPAPPEPEPEPVPAEDWSGAVEEGPYHWGSWRLYVR